MKKRKWIDKKCCSWETFFTGFMSAVAYYKVPAVLIDKCKARHDWRVYSCTGTEALLNQRRELLAEMY